MENEVLELSPHHVDV
jgi:hypothetical protein